MKFGVNRKSFEKISNGILRILSLGAPRPPCHTTPIFLLNVTGKYDFHFSIDSGDVVK